MIDAEWIAEFDRATGLNLDVHLDAFVAFTESSYPALDAYFAGVTPTLDTTAYNELLRLRTDNLRALQEYQNRSGQWKNYGMYEVLDTLETIQLHLDTALNLPRYARAGADRSSFVTNSVFDTPLRNGQTLENLARNGLLAENPEDDWIDLAISNDLREVDYGPETESQSLQAPLLSTLRVRVESVVDTMQGSNLLGRDMARRIRFYNDDLQVLNGPATYTQAVEILGGMFKGDNPEFPEQGVDARLVVGTNTASIFHSLITRQLNDLFSGDDTIASLEIQGYNIKGSKLFVEARVTSVYGEVENQTFSPNLP